MNGTDPRTSAPGRVDRSAADRAQPDGEPELTFRLTPTEAELVLEALGAMRYSTVYRLIAKMQVQARSQVDEASEAGA
jgi:hypothetical protein